MRWKHAPVFGLAEHVRQHAECPVGAAWRRFGVFDEPCQHDLLIDLVEKQLAECRQELGVAINVVRLDGARLPFDRPAPPVGGAELVKLRRRARLLAACQRIAPDLGFKDQQLRLAARLGLGNDRRIAKMDLANDAPDAGEHDPGSPAAGVEAKAEARQGLVPDDTVVLDKRIEVAAREAAGGEFCRRWEQPLAHLRAPLASKPVARAI
jgi:hypothetical protein